MEIVVPTVAATRNLPESKAFGNAFSGPHGGGLAEGGIGFRAGFA